MLLRMLLLLLPLPPLLLLLLLLPPLLCLLLLWRRRRLLSRRRLLLHRWGRRRAHKHAARPLIFRLCTAAAELARLDLHAGAQLAVAAHSWLLLRARAVVSQPPPHGAGRARGRQHGSCRRSRSLERGRQSRGYRAQHRACHAAPLPLLPIVLLLRAVAQPLAGHCRVRRQACLRRRRRRRSACCSDRLCILFWLLLLLRPATFPSLREVCRCLVLWGHGAAAAMQGRRQRRVGRGFQASSNPLSGFLSRGAARQRVCSKATNLGPPTRLAGRSPAGAPALREPASHPQQNPQRKSRPAAPARRATHLALTRGCARAMRAACTAPPARPPISEGCMGIVWVSNYKLARGTGAKRLHSAAVASRARGSGGARPARAGALLRF